mgnify:CR=1 FL=1
MSSASSSFVEPGELWKKTNRAGLKGEQPMREKSIHVVFTKPAQKACRSRLPGLHSFEGISI